MAEFFDGKVCVARPDRSFIGGRWVEPASGKRIYDAIHLADETSFGLARAVFINDADAAYRITRLVRAGSMSQNGLKPDFHIAFGGFKQPGLGREGGLEAVQPYLETKTMVLDAMPHELAA